MRASPQRYCTQELTAAAPAAARTSVSSALPHVQGHEQALGQCPPHTAPCVPRNLSRASCRGLSTPSPLYEPQKDTAHGLHRGSAR